MKIAIITLPLHINYGGILQAFALQTILERKGHSVIIIDRDYNYPSAKLLFFRMLSLVKTCYRRYVCKDKRYRLMNPFSLSFRALKLEGHSTLPFVYKYIKLSHKIRTSYAFNRYLKNNEIDCCVVGSDQIWRKKYAPSLNDAYLSGVNGKKIKKIAYAVSFGTDVWEYDTKETDKCKILVHDFKAISVREKTGCKFCEDFFKIKADHVLDPTMLLTPQDYQNVIQSVNTLPSNGNLLCYFLDSTTETQNMINSFCDEERLIPFNINWKIKDTIYLEQPSVEQWLRGFVDAEFVITDSFHACVFSILFNKQFVVLGNKERGADRMLSLLRMFGLENRFVSSFEEFISCKERLLQEIDYTRVNHILEDLRGKSINYIDTYIEK